MEEERSLSPSAAQIRAARALLGWSQAEAARRFKIGVNTLSRAETGERLFGERIQEDVMEVFEQAGIVFTRGNGLEGVSVKVEKAP